MKITEALVTEHRILLEVLDFIESALPSINSIEETRQFGRLLNKLLSRHGHAEESLLMVALDHVLEEKGELTHLHHDHREIDHRLQELIDETDVSKARNLLKTVTAAARKHFAFEEKSIFVLADKVLQPDTLAKLGRAIAER